MKYIYERHLFSTAGGHLWQSSHLNSHCYINHAKIKLFRLSFTKIVEFRFHSVWQLLRVVWFEQKQSADQSYFRKNESDFGSYQGKHWSKENTLRPQSVIIKERCQKLLCRFFSAKKGEGVPQNPSDIFCQKNLPQRGGVGKVPPSPPPPILPSFWPKGRHILVQKQFF